MAIKIKAAFCEKNILKKKPKKGKINTTPYAYLSPAIFIIALIYLFPLLDVFRGSFMDMRKWPGEFIGFKNYQIVFTDKLFYQSILHNIEFILIVPVIVIIALIVSVVLHEKIFGAKFYRSVIFIPYIVPLVAIGIAFSFFFQLSGGLNQILKLVHLDFFAKDWLGNSNLALPAVATAIAWRELGFAIILFVARLGSVSNEVVEASLIDGAGWWTRLLKIYVPELVNVIQFYVIISIITMLSQIFGYIFVITNGGPANATVVAETYIYKQAFLLNHMGAAEVVAVVLIIMTIGILLILNKMRLKLGDDFE